MPTGTKIAVIVLVVLLGAAGLYYAFVPPTTAPKFDASKGAGSTSSETPRSTLPSGGLGTAQNGTTTPSGTTPSLNELIERQRAASGSTTGTNTGTNTGAPGTTTAGSTAAGSTTTGSTTTGATTTGSTTTGSTTTPGTDGNLPTGGSASGTIGAANGTGTTGQGAPSGATASNQPKPGRPFGNGNPTSAGGGITTGTGDAAKSGNTTSGTTTAKKTPEPSAAGDNATTHIVKKGETMGSIAKLRLGSASKWHLIAKANPTIDPNAMKVGSKLRMPNAPTTAGAAVASAPTSNPATKSSGSGAQAATSGGTHVVAKGETLSSISKKHYGDSKYWKAIASANPKINANSLSVGAKLSIPPKSAIAAVEP